MNKPKDTMDASLQSRLLAVLAADAVGYSRLMSLDDRGTVAALDAARTVFSMEIAGHDGRVIDMAGDSVLAVFTTATAAVKAALAIQRQLGSAAANEAPDDRRMRFRLGIHVGDVLEKADGTVYGDGVNIAARLEGLAEPGGIAVSHAVHGIVAGRVESTFVDVGEQVVKNIAQPLRVYRLGATAGSAAPATDEARQLGTVQPLCFGAVEFRPAQRQLQVDGREVRIGGRAFDVLSHLIAHRHRVVPKHQLLEHVWQGMDVNEGNLQSQVSALRKLLGTRAIATIPGRGYQFTLAQEDEPGAAAAPPTPPAPATTTSVLPPAPIGMVGRDDELAALERLLQQHRLVTVVGAGGIGKTTVALAAAHALQDAEPDGVAWAELAPVSDPALLASVVAQALGISVAGNNPQASLVKALAERRMLLMLDNAEHLLDAVAALVQAVLAGAAGVRVLVTSQAALNLGAERQFRLGALAAPDLGASVEVALTYGAVALFVDQAQAADRHFKLTQDNLSAVVDLCVHLDGVALAIKLATARLPLFGLPGLQARLSERFRLLGHGPRSAPTRQQTLRAALDWSHGLLAPNEQTVFRRLAVLSSGFLLDLAAKVACDGAQDEWEVIEALGALVDRSLVMLDPQTDGRYRLLESAREYALERLDETGERSATNERAARVLREHFPALAEAEPQTMARHLSDGGCLEEALVEWERAAAMALARSANVEAALHLDKAIQLTRALAAEASDPVMWQRKELALQLRLGPVVMMTKGLGSGASERLYNEALALSHKVGAPSDALVATFNLWFIAESQLKLDRAAELIAQTMRLAQATGDDRFMVHARHAAFTTAATTGQFAQVLSDAEDGYRRYRPIDREFHQSTFGGHDPGLCAVGHSAMALWLLGRPDEAYARVEELKRWISESSHPPSRVIGHYITCLVFVWAREAQRMHAMAEETLAICRRMSLQQYEGLFTIFSTWAAAMLGLDRSVAARLTEGLTKFESTGTKLRVSLLKTMAAEACAAAGQLQEGLVFVKQGLRELVERKEFGWHAYALVVRGTLFSNAWQVADAQASFTEALEVARSQGGRGFELRAANGLARLWQETGRGAQARALIEPLLAHIAPGFSTPDLDEAHKVLSAC